MATGEIGTAGVEPLGDGDLDAVVGSSGVTLVEFRAEWCGGCRRMEPILESIAADTGAAVRTVDVETHLETAIEFGARSTPAFVLFADGHPVKRLRGARTEAELRELVDRYGTPGAGGR